MMKVGDCIKVKTRTKDDVFGECVYRVTEVGVWCPHCKANDGIKFVMLGGSGPSARPGFPVVDCPARVRANMAEGITVVMTEAQAQQAVAFYGAKGAQKPGREIEM
jgi:hypothetical protein